MKLKSLLPLGAVLLLLAAGCYPSKSDVGFQARGTGRADTAWKAEADYGKLAAPTWRDTVRSRPRSTLAGQKLINLDFHDTPVHQVLARMSSRLGCRLTLTRAASNYIHRKDLRITARVGRVSSDLAFEVIRAQLEAKGLTLEEAPNASTLGKPHFLLDRSVMREATVAAGR